MKTLYQSLVDYEISLLKAIADCRAISINSLNQAEVVKQLTEALLSPTRMAIALADLPKAEIEALQFLWQSKGQVESGRFSQLYGLIRLMGAARLERERPWQKPENPAEGLWYKGFIYKAFQVTDHGGVEMIYIPKDLLPLLRTQAIAFADEQSAPSPSATFTLSAILPPLIIVKVEGRLRENIFSLLVSLQTKPIRWAPSKEDELDTLAAVLLPPLITAWSSKSELIFLLHLAKQANLIKVEQNQLKPNREATRTWLQAPESQQIQFLQHSWQTDATWNDLGHVAELLPPPVGWQNDPLLARTKILGYLLRLAEINWFAMHDFISAIKRTEPNFQRPDGDYNHWYIQNERGDFLMGFANWDKIEGQLIHYLLTNPLAWLGIVEVGANSLKDKLTSFRVTPSGEIFLKNQAETIPSLLNSQGEESDVCGIQVGTNFQVVVSANGNLYDRFQLARFANLDRREQEQTRYYLTPTSISRAIQHGITPDQITAFLTRASHHQAPTEVLETLQIWAARPGTVRLEQVVLLHLHHADLVEELYQHASLRPLLGERINPTTILVASHDVPMLQRLLTEFGYL